MACGQKLFTSKQQIATAWKLPVCFMHIPVTNLESAWFSYFYITENFGKSYHSLNIVSVQQ